MLLAPNLSSFNNRISCSLCFCVLFFTFALCAFCLAYSWQSVIFFPLLSIPSSISRRICCSISRSEGFSRFPFGVTSVGVNLQAYTYCVFPNASTYLYKYFPSFLWLSPVCRTRPLLSRFFSFKVSAPFLVGKSLDMTCVHHNTYKAHLH